MLHQALPLTLARVMLVKSLQHFKGHHLVSWKSLGSHLQLTPSSSLETKWFLDSDTCWTWSMISSSKSSRIYAMPCVQQQAHSSQFSWQDTLKCSHVLGSGCHEISCVRKSVRSLTRDLHPCTLLPLDQELHLSSGLVLAWVMPVPDCWSWSTFSDLPCFGCKSSSSLRTCLEITGLVDDADYHQTCCSSSGLVYISSFWKI